MKIYVAGKVSKESVFGTHDWRDNFCEELERLSDIKIENIDPTKADVIQSDPVMIFGCDSYLISKCDVMIVYLSDDISVGGSQEIMIAKYFKKPVIGLAKYGGKFNGDEKVHLNEVIKDYKDPFVFSTCDIVCNTTLEVANTLKHISKIEPKSLNIIPDSINLYLQRKV